MSATRKSAPADRTTSGTAPLVAVIGGCNRVGLPFGVALASAGFETRLIDPDEAAVRSVQSGKFPFLEKNGDRALAAALERKRLAASTDPEFCRDANVFVFTASTPVDEHLHPSITAVRSVLACYENFFAPDALVILRGTLAPGTSSLLASQLKERHPGIRVVYCPERVAQGEALEEIGIYPQLVGAETDADFQAVYAVVSKLSPFVIHLDYLEAEMTNLMHNAWRYLQFAIGNQFYMIAEKNLVDFHRLYRAISHNYPRAAGYARPGLTAGPSLFDDTMQLASFYQHQFQLGHSAMLVNEGLADLLVERAAEAVGGKLWDKTVGVLGLAFKPNNDDCRNSLSFRIKKGLEFGGANVLLHDPYVADSTPLETVLSSSDAIVLATPHEAYKSLSFRQPLVDVWDFYKRATLDVRPGRT